jgi:hypothetical protein
MKKMTLIPFTAASQQRPPPLQSNQERELKQMIGALVARNNTLKNTNIATQTPSFQQNSDTQTPTIQRNIQTQTMNDDDDEDDVDQQETLTKNVSTGTADNQMSSAISNYASLLENGLQALSEHGFKWGSDMKLKGSDISVIKVIETLAAGALSSKDKKIQTIVNQVKGPVIAGAIGTPPPPSKTTNKRISKPSVKKIESEEAGTSKQKKKKSRLSAPFKTQ